MEQNKFHPRFFVVIHAQHSLNDDYGLAHALGSTKTAYDNGADGVFLIPDYDNEKNGYSQRATAADLFVYYQEIKKSFPDYPVGVNFLQRFEYMQISLIEKISKTNFDMIQSDTSVTDKILFQSMENTEFFTGLAFKYSRNEKARGEELKKMCESVPKNKNVIPTTSGPETGKAAEINKIKEIRKYLSSDKRLGIASGISLENVDKFLEAGITDFLVATSLIKEKKNGYDILDGEKISKLAKKF